MVIVAGVLGVCGLACELNDLMAVIKMPVFNVLVIILLGEKLEMDFPALIERPSMLEYEIISADLQIRIYFLLLSR